MGRSKELFMEVQQMHHHNDQREQYYAQPQTRKDYTEAKSRKRTQTIKKVYSSK